MHIGSKLRYQRKNNVMYAWWLSPSKYVREAVNNCVKILRDNFEGEYSLPKQAPNTFMYEYEPEIEISEPIYPEQASYFQSLIGVIICMV